MTIAILPARLANQIAAGEVVERPASVVKELVENSLDAGAKKITVEIEKGGVKRIKITDDGKGIVKDELTLALSRHATSKIKDLDDLESISSLGFRGEALASISSVARLTLTSKPAAQENAWQAYAQGRDMEVIVKPAAHPNGTSIEVEDLFFNTPARRKFLRTEKTEFGHIDELIKRIALARFDVAFTLVHNGKVVRNFRPAKDESQYSKRIGAVCGSNFLNNAISVDCRHDDMRLWGWIGRPQDARGQNDLCYSYVNGRMMRDKLINHAIRQAYSDMIDSSQYPPFVLFFSLDFHEVDVNVHPAKHEVRFQQSRYVHDFICSVVASALAENIQPHMAQSQLDGESEQNQPEQMFQPSNENPQVREYVAPLQFDRQLGTNNSAGASQGFSTSARQDYQPAYHGASSSFNSGGSSGARVNTRAQMESMKALYQTPIETTGFQEQPTSYATSAQVIGEDENSIQPLLMASDSVLVAQYQSTLFAIPLTEVALVLKHQELLSRWHSGLVAQPLLLPVKVNLDDDQMVLVNNHQSLLEMSGIKLNIPSKGKVQIRQFPAQLRESNISECFIALLSELAKIDQIDDNQWCQVLARQMVASSFSFEQACALLSEAKAVYQTEFVEKLQSFAKPIDLTPYT